MYVDYKEVGKRIAKRRKELGLKQYQVNETADLSDKYLSNIETARSIPSIDVLMRICSALRSTPNDFLIGAVDTKAAEDKPAALSDKIKKLDDSKIEFLSNFIDWLYSQKI